MERKMKIGLFVVIIATLKFVSAVDYCKIKSCQNRQHTVCLYPGVEPSSKCRGYQGSGLSESEKTKVLNLHNKLRQKVASGNEMAGSPGPQPAAKNMPNLQWDNEIASIAQRWADQCTWGHDSCRDVERFGVGQNIAVIGTTGNVNDIQVESMVQSWYDEVKYFDKNQVAHFSGKGADGKDVGHYTQLVWANSNYLGCGATKYKDGEYNQFYLVCNYGPSGNWIGEPVYQAV